MKWESSLSLMAPTGTYEAQESQCLLTLWSLDRDFISSHDKDCDVVLINTGVKSPNMALWKLASTNIVILEVIHVQHKDTHPWTEMGARIFLSFLIVGQFTDIAWAVMTATTALRRLADDSRTLRASQTVHCQSVHQMHVCRKWSKPHIPLTKPLLDHTYNVQSVLPGLLGQPLEKLKHTATNLMVSLITLPCGVQLTSGVIWSLSQSVKDMSVALLLWLNQKIIISIKCSPVVEKIEPKPAFSSC